MLFNTSSFGYYYYSGTLIAAVFTKNNIYLFSDGRTTYNKSGKIALNSVSKVHQITEKIGMLTAGVYIPELMEEIKSEKGSLHCNIEDIVKIIQKILIKKWDLITTKKDRRLIVFIVGYDNNDLPRLFIIDNMYKPPFLIKERELNVRTNSLELAVLCTGGGNKFDPSKIMTSYIKKYENQHIPKDQYINLAFQSTMKDIEKYHSSVGGEIFSLIINNFQQGNPPDRASPGM